MEEAVAKKKKPIYVLSADAAPVPSYTPRSQKQNMDGNADEFETVGTRRGRFESYDSDSDDDRIPKDLLVKLNPDKQSFCSTLNLIMNQFQVNAGQSSIMQENLEAITKLLTAKNMEISGGWEHPSELAI